jgi:hypothetical protein
MRQWLEAVAEFQPDWSKAFVATVSLKRLGPDERAFAAAHHAPGFDVPKVGARVSAV